MCYSCVNLRGKFAKRHNVARRIVAGAGAAAATRRAAQRVVGYGIKKRGARIVLILSCSIVNSFPSSQTAPVQMHLINKREQTADNLDRPRGTNLLALSQRCV